MIDDDDTDRTLTEIAARIRQKLVQARTSSMVSLNVLREVGCELNSAHAKLGRGAFGHWAEQNGFRKSWASRLKKLDHAWEDVRAALEWAEESRGLESRDYSADGALRLLAEHRGSKSTDALSMQPDAKKPRQNRVHELEEACQHLTLEGDKKDQLTRDLAEQVDWLKAGQDQEAQRHATDVQQRDERIKELEERVRQLEAQLQDRPTKTKARPRKQAVADLPKVARPGSGESPLARGSSVQ